jgi:hypothetical protein
VCLSSVRESIQEERSWIWEKLTIPKDSILIEEVKRERENQILSSIRRGIRERLSLQAGERKGGVSEAWQRRFLSRRASRRMNNKHITVEKRMKKRKEEYIMIYELYQ